MVFRRHKALWQGLCLLIFVGITFKFSYNYYKNNEMKLRAANIRHHELLEERNKFSRELEDVTESRNALEISIRTKVHQFSEKKKEWDEERNRLQNEANKAKANFDALDSEHRMLKAKEDELQSSYDHIQKSFDRLKEDHNKLDSEHRNNFQELKDKNEKIISSLQKQVEHYQKQEHSLQIKVQDLQESVTQYQNVVAKLQQKLSKVEKSQQESDKVSEVKNYQKESNVAGQDGLHSKLKRRKAVKEIIPKFNAEKGLKNSHDTLGDSDTALKHKQSVQDVGKLAEVKPEEEVKKNENDVKDNVELPKADIVDDVVVKGGEQRDFNNIKNKNDDNIEIISQDGKAERNFNLDELPNLELNEKQGQVGEQARKREKRDEDEEMNNDGKSDDDEEIALQDKEVDVVDEDDGNEMLDQPENLLKREGEVHDRDHNLK